MPMGSGLGALIRLGASVELDSDLQTIFIGCPTTAAYTTTFVGCPEGHLGADYELETTGNHLLYRVAIVGAEVHVCASLLDSIGVPELLLKTPDSEDGWRLCSRFISALEKYEVRSLERPITVGNRSMMIPAHAG
jgi:hypothetical protein